MTDREKAIVMAYTGVTMLTGDKFNVFHKYIEELLGHPVMTHELADQDVQDEITRKSKEDFIALCRDNSVTKCNTNDLISREAAIEAISYHEDIDNEAYKIVKRILTLQEAVPAGQAVRVAGLSRRETA